MIFKDQEQFTKKNSDKLLSVLWWLDYSSQNDS